MIELTLPDGSPGTVNLALVDYFQPSDDETLIAFTGGNTITVTEPYDTVAEVMNPERQAGC